MLFSDDIEVYSISWDKGNWEQGNRATNHMRTVDPPTVALRTQRASKLGHGEYTSGEGEEIVGEYNEKLTHCNMRHMRPMVVTRVTNFIKCVHAID